MPNANKRTIENVNESEDIIKINSNNLEEVKSTTTTIVNNDNDNNNNNENNIDQSDETTNNKRVKLNDDDNDQHQQQTETEENNNSLKRQQKKQVNSVKFTNVSVYHFPREQGYQCIPSVGTNTIGMSFNHSHCDNYTIDEFMNYKRSLHLNVIENDVNCKRMLYKTLKNATTNMQINEASNSSSGSSTSDTTTTTTTTRTSGLSDLDGGNEGDIDDEMDDDVFINKFNPKEVDYFNDINVDLPVNNEYFCQLLTPTERARIIKLNSHSVDDSESIDINQVRKSREQCGCQCKDTCETETCICMKNGICCQLDKLKFPCSCSIRRCKNPNGLKRFDQRSVRKHYDYVLYPELVAQAEAEAKAKALATANKRSRKKSRSSSSKQQTKNIKTKRNSQEDEEEKNEPNKNNEKNVGDDNKCLDVLPYQPFNLFNYYLTYLTKKQ